jgi:hypothetical protein
VEVVLQAIAKCFLFYWIAVKLRVLIYDFDSFDRNSTWWFTLMGLVEYEILFE